MTLVHFTYSAGYHRPETGGVVFMPHRKHAANETTVLPRPFTRPLVDGVVEVDLEPTSDDWLWSVTHDHDTRFYAIPDTDGVINHTELIPVAPSTLTHRIEPVWWAELRQHQQFIADYVNESRNSVREAIDTVNTVHDTLKTAVSDAQRHESVAGAYSRQAQASNEQAWEASKGPDGAAQRAKDEADRAEIYRDESNTNRVESGVEADRSATHAAEARADYERIQEYTEGWDSLEDAIGDAKTEADRSQTHASESTTARNEAVTARDEAVTARDEAVTARDGMIIGATVDGDDLLFDTVDGATVEAGNVRGPATVFDVNSEKPFTVDTSAGEVVMFGDVMIKGDTGEIDVTQLVNSDVGWFGDELRVTVQRVNNTVTLSVQRIQNDGTETGNVNIFNLPEGFRSTNSIYGKKTFREKQVQLRSGYNLVIVDPASTLDYFYITFTTNDPWPSTLPVE